MSCTLRQILRHGYVVYKGIEAHDYLKFLDLSDKGKARFFEGCPRKPE